MFLSEVKCEERRTLRTPRAALENIDIPLCIITIVISLSVRCVVFLQ